LANRYPDDPYDVATIFEVLEHTTDPFQVACSLRKVLKPGGQLVLSVPGSRRWPVLFDPEVDAPPHHLTLWTQEALERLLARAGFHVLSINSKPLAVDDFGLHLMWRLRKTFWKVQANPGHDNRAEALMKDRPSTALGVARRLAKAGLLPLCYALRLNPRAGGFTLLAHCERP
jgi:SAM-dependent methyltransferase